MKAFPIPIGADSKSEKAINAFQKKLGHLVISKQEIDFIIQGVMKAQEPRDKERAEKEKEKRQEKAARATAKRSYQSR